MVIGSQMQQSGGGFRELYVHWGGLGGVLGFPPPVGLLTAPTPDLNVRSVPLTEASARFTDNAP
jgi:hypothetical protein